MNDNKKKDFWAYFQNPNGSYHIPVWLIIVGFCINWLLGVGLLFARLCEDKSFAASCEDASYVPCEPSDSEPKAKAAATAATKAKSKTKAKAKAKKSPAAILTGLGIFAAAAGVLGLPDSVQYLVWNIQNDGSISYGLEEVANNCIWIISGLAMILGAQRIRKGQRIQQKITAIVGDAQNMPISEIAAALPASESKTIKYLNKAVDRGLFGGKAYLDMRSECLVVKGPAPMSKQEQEAARRAAEEAAKEEDTLDEYGRILKEIRDINDKIPGEDFSAKIDRLEDLTAKIFKLVQEQPEKQKKLRKFINYYLPTSLKLLHNYEQLDAQGIEGKNISDAKQQIEETMDTMISAFEKQLDNLFSAESMDISADIAAMQNLMRADGLIENEFSDSLK